jgi:error-prone DNA polymerase
MKRRVPEIQKDELVLLAEIGALNSIGGEARLHRRSALWQVERAARPAGPLLEVAAGQGPRHLPAEEEKEDLRFEISDLKEESPLAAMNVEERLVADFRGTGMTVGPHPMRYCRAEMNARGVTPAGRLRHLANGQAVRIAGGVIARQRPGTAKGFVFMSLEDETGISNAIITPDVFDRNRLVVVGQQFLLIEGRLQNLDGVISVKAERIEPLSITEAVTASHDFH